MSDIGLVNFIKNEFDNGKSLEEVSQILIGNGYQQQQVDDIFIELGYIKAINPTGDTTLPTVGFGTDTVEVGEKKETDRKQGISILGVILIIIWMVIFTVIKIVKFNIQKKVDVNKTSESWIFGNCYIGSKSYNTWDSFCQNNKLQYCNSQAKWETKECPSGCKDGLNACNNQCKFVNDFVKSGSVVCINDVLSTCNSDGTWTNQKCEFGCNHNPMSCNSASNSTKKICLLDSVLYDVNDRVCHNDMIKICDNDGSFDTQTCIWGCEIGERYCNDSPPKRCQLDGNKVQVGSACYNQKEIRKCKLDGTWEVEICPYGCQDSFGQCNPGPDSLYRCQYYPNGSKNFYVQIGKKECIANKKRTCLSDGTWKIEDCEFGCNKEIDECVVKCKWQNLSYQIGEEKCRDGKSIEKCNSNGTWSTITTCKSGCNFGSTYCNSR